MLNVSIESLWHAWVLFRRGKKRSVAIEEFAYALEDNLLSLHRELDRGRYRHGGYRQFTVTDNKRRDISVASVRDRVVHRLVYEYLVELYDCTFIFDAWSCRKEKGLLGAVERTQDFLRRYPRSFIWRSDITKFFDSVSQDVLLKILRRKINDEKVFWLLKEILSSYSCAARARERERERERRNGPKKGYANRQSDKPDICQYIFE